MLKLHPFESAVKGAEFWALLLLYSHAHTLTMYIHIHAHTTHTHTHPVPTPTQCLHPHTRPHTPTHTHKHTHTNRKRTPLFCFSKYFIRDFIQIKSLHKINAKFQSKYKCSFLFTHVTQC